MSLSRHAKPLDGVSVLALGTAIATRISAGWLADSGARVAAFRPGWRVPEPGSPEDRFERQVARNVHEPDFELADPYDVVITDTPARLLVSNVPEHLLNTAVVIEITSPLEGSQSYTDSLTSDMILWARSGLGYLTREMDSDGRFAAPCLPLNRQASILAGIAAGTAAMAALTEHREDSLAPRHIEIDQLELLALLPMQPIGFAQMDARIIGAPQVAAFRMPGGTVATANGHAYIGPVEADHWAKLLRLIGELDPIAEEVEANPSILRAEADAIDTRIRAWARELTSEHIADTCQSQHIPIVPVYRPDQVVRDAHLRARNFFRDGSDDGVGLNLPWLADVGEPSQKNAPGRGHVVRKGGSDLPLAGLRILDLSWAWAGPFATTLLSDLGAEVINVEWHPRASNLRRNPPFAGKRHESNNTAAWWSANQRGKFSIGVNLKTAEGKQIVSDLAAQSDVVVENFSPGVVDRLGVGFSDLLAVNERLVYVSLSAFGQTGPRSHYIGYGTQVYAAAGAGYATSQDGHTCSQMYIPYPDPVSGLGGAFAIAAFVRNARATGRPARVDLSELETVAAVTLEPLLDALAETHVGDASVSVQPHYRVIRTADEHYVVLIATSADDWRRVQTAIGAETQNEIESTAQTLNADELITRVRDAGLHAERIVHSADVLEDPYLLDRGFWVRDESPEIRASGTQIGASLWRVDGERTAIWRGAPPLFSDTREVLSGLLGKTPSDTDELYARGIVE